MAFYLQSMKILAICSIVLFVDTELDDSSSNDTNESELEADGDDVEVDEYYSRLAFSEY